MHTPIRWLVPALSAGMLLLTAPGAWAEDNPSSMPAPPAKAQGAKGADTPRPDQLEPGVETSGAGAPAESRPTLQFGVQPDSQLKPNAAAKPDASSKADATSKPDAGPSRKAKAASKVAAGPGSPKAGAGAGKAQDRIELDTTQITGNRELPKVLYIVPWKRSDLGDLVGKPMNSVVDEVLSPVDRDVFKRENRYYDALKPDEAKQPGAAASAQGGKP